MYPRVSRSAMLIWTLDRYNIHSPNSTRISERTICIHLPSTFIHAIVIIGILHHHFLAKLRTLSVDMLSHPNFHKCEHFAQELESFDSAHRCAVRANGSSQYGCVPHSPNSQTQALVGTTVEQILRFQRCFSQTLQKHVLMKLGNHWSSLVWFSLTARLSSTCPWS